MNEQSKAWIDAETKIADAPEDHHDQLRLWLRLFTVARLMENEVRSRLQDEFDVTFPRFDILSQLYRVPEGLILGELSQRLMVSPGNITAVIKRLMDDGLIVRIQNPNDRRENIVRMTPLGTARFAEMAAAHEGWIRSLCEGLSPSDVKSLMSLLLKMKTSVRRSLAKSR
ncbi:MarR family winged helix-turn-helix transcriptional regulator [Devosia elaeis]|uniref:Transcriptional regulator n=1 Tax=Devosia elaeis TaxID=1770058 RepID=A0A178I4I5_9HYPH|nr:MarR family transcriptional regulator [Devosia elaeis]OAM79068.1 transcriptional regulator [Devosia elaeis]